MPKKKQENFLNPPAEKTSYDKSPIVVLPVPYERTTTYGKGTKAAPRAVIEASAQVEMFDDELFKDLEDVYIHTAEPVKTEGRALEDSLKRIRRAASQPVGDGKFVVAIGGEHTITYPLIQAAADAHGPLSVLQIDSHLDLRDSWEGSRWNHACVMRRVLDDGHTVLGVGIRNVSAEEHEFVTKKKLRPFFARDIVGREGWTDEVLGRLNDPVYITIDADGLDPSVIRSVGTPEPGGLGWYEMLRLLRQVFENRRVVGCDVVELAPTTSDAASDFAAARLIAKLIAYHEFLK